HGRIMKTQDEEPDQNEIALRSPIGKGISLQDREHVRANAVPGTRRESGRRLRGSGWGISSPFPLRAGSSRRSSQGRATPRTFAGRECLACRSARSGTAAPGTPAKAPNPATAKEGSKL